MIFLILSRRPENFLFVLLAPRNSSQVQLYLRLLTYYRNLVVLLVLFRACICTLGKKKVQRALAMRQSPQDVRYTFWTVYPARKARTPRVCNPVTCPNYEECWPSPFSLTLSKHNRALALAARRTVPVPVCLYLKPFPLMAFRYLACVSHLWNFELVSGVHEFLSSGRLFIPIAINVCRFVGWHLAIRRLLVRLCSRTDRDSSYELVSEFWKTREIMLWSGSPRSIN